MRLKLERIDHKVMPGGDFLNEYTAIFNNEKGFGIRYKILLDRYSKESWIETICKLYSEKPIEPVSINPEIEHLKRNSQEVSK